MGLVDAPSGKWLCTECCLTFSKLSLFRNALLQCEIHILAKFIIRRKFCSDVLKENSVNGFFLFCFVCLFVVVVVFNPYQFVPRGRGI